MMTAALCRKGLHELTPDNLAPRSDGGFRCRQCRDGWNRARSTRRGDTAEVRERRRTRVAELTRQGRSASDVAAILGITERTVQRDRAAKGIAQPASRPLTATQLDRARQLLADGAPYKEVARTIGSDTTTLAKHFPGQGWTRQQVSEWTAMLRATAAPSTRCRRGHPRTPENTHVDAHGWRVCRTCARESQARRRSAA